MFSCPLHVIGALEKPSNKISLHMNTKKKKARKQNNKINTLMGKGE